jgi:hypothetical protein
MTEKNAAAIPKKELSHSVLASFRANPDLSVSERQSLFIALPKTRSTPGGYLLAIRARPHAVRVPPNP